MSELTTLHPYDPAFIARYVAALRQELPAEALLLEEPSWAEREMARARRAYPRALTGSEADANAISYGLARLLSANEPVFYVPGAAFTQLEARVERGIGMLLRPPSRLYAEGGLEIAAARAMPIRLDAGGGMMGGAFMPPALVPRYRELLEERLDRLARRMAEAELDAPAMLGLLLESAAYAADRGLGLYEAADVIVPGVPESQPPRLRFVAPDRKRLDRDLRQRLEAAARPPKQPGLLTRLLGRGGAAPPPAAPPEISFSWRNRNDVTPPPDPSWREEQPE